MTEMDQVGAPTKWSAIWQVFFQPSDNIKKTIGFVIEQRQKTQFDQAKKLSDFMAMISRLVFCCIFVAGVVGSIEATREVDNPLINSLTFRAFLSICLFASVQIGLQMLFKIEGIIFWHFVKLANDKKNVFLRIFVLVVGLLNSLVLPMSIGFTVYIIAQPAILNLVKPFINKMSDNGHQMPISNTSSELIKPAK